jgi:oligopeptide transport system ATP-binding protein
VPVLDVRGLRVRFEARDGVVRAVEDVSFALEAGETLGIVGESGSGKSVTNLALLGLLPRPPAVVTAESASFLDGDLLRMSARELRGVRGKEIAMIFQDPMTALNPLLTVARQLTEVLEVHENATPRAARARSREALFEVGLSDPDANLDAYPHELSGGMRQRVMIAMALLCKPKVLIADEPTTALDVTIQAQILDLLRDVQARHGTAIVLITHSLGVVAGLCDRVNVMYAGRIVESATTSALFAKPLHPYTRGLLASVPSLDSDVTARLTSIPGAPPDLARLGLGCAFEPRCAFALERCASERPALEEIEGEHRSACFVARELADGRARAPRDLQGEPR